MKVKGYDLKIMIRCIIGVVILAFPFISLSDTPKSIGKIIGLQKNNWSLKVVSSQTKVEDATKDMPLYEGDSIETITGQSVLIRLEDQTQIFIGPSTRMTLRNWTGRDSENRKIPTIVLHGGMIKLLVNKVYSQHEPFVVETKYGVAAVRGTEFVIETGIAGRLSRVKRLTPQQVLVRKYEVEIHVLEGEVHFAKNLGDLFSNEDKIMKLVSGDTSVLRPMLNEPETKNRFDVQTYRKYLWGAVPKIVIALKQGLSNESRAELALAPDASQLHYTDADQNRQIASEGDEVEKALRKKRKRKHPGQDIELKRR